MTEATGPDPALTLHEVTIAYGAAPVVSDVSLAVGRGQWLAIVGPNGAGK